ncbi:MAG: O-antigen ligase family protein [Flavobacteriaceae bacterium]
MEKHIHRIYLCYYISTLGFFVGLFIYNYVNGYVNEFIFKNYSERLNSKLGKYSLHPIYASMYIGVAVLLSFKIYEKLNRVGSKILIIIGNIFLFLTIALLARKSVFALLVLMCAFVFFTKQKKKEIFLYLIFITALFYISFQIPALKIRYLEFFNTFFNNSNSQIGSTFYRLNIYKCGIDSIFVSPWFGYGLGDTKSVLIECYNTKMEVFNGQYFNSHNQYISVWLSSGILGFLSLVSMMVYNIKLMIRNSFIIETLILLLLTITMMIENILERQSGVILFSFFINFFAFLIPQKRNIN